MHIYLIGARPVLFELPATLFRKMKLPAHLIFSLLLSAGCSDTPLIKSSDRPGARNEATASATVIPSPPPAAQLAASPSTGPAASTILPSANPGHTVRCNGGEQTLRSCYDQADEICEAQKHFVSNILKIEESGSGNQIARALSFKCNTEISYGNVGFPDNARVPALQKKPSLEQRLLLGN
jgi:hypothetical protein